MKIFENGLDNLLDTISRNVYHMFDGAEEIGTSDVSCCVRAVLGEYYDNVDDAHEVEWSAVRNGILSEIRG